jgi:hypothetical protein
VWEEEVDHGEVGATIPALPPHVHALPLPSGIGLGLSGDDDGDGDEDQALCLSQRFSKCVSTSSSGYGGGISKQAQQVDEDSIYFMDTGKRST